MRGHDQQNLFPEASRQSGLASLESFIAPRASLRERLAQGKHLRRQVPRKAHATPPASGKQRDPIEVLQLQNSTRVQKLVPVRNARMLASPFAFYRGSAAIMAADLARTPVTGLSVVACGDMHVLNFGLFGSAERNLIFAINDFDEVHPGPWEWDLKRLATSAVLAVRHLDGDDVDAEHAAHALVGAYRKRMQRYARMGYLETWYDQIDENAIIRSLPEDLRAKVRRVARRARQRGHISTLDKLTTLVGGQARLIEDPPLIVRETALEDGTPIMTALGVMLKAYFASLPDDRKRLLSKYRIVDVARKVVGVGSVGTKCWVVLLEGSSESDPLFLQIKQALPSVLAPYATTELPFRNDGRRVVVGQRMIQGSPDIFLGWGGGENNCFYVRQLADMKGGAQFAEGDRAAVRGFTEYCRLCGWALALAHAKSRDPAMIAGYCGTGEGLDEAIAKFSRGYADLVVRDHARMTAAAKSGRIQVSNEILA